MNMKAAAKRNAVNDILKKLNMHGSVSCLPPVAIDNANCSSLATCGLVDGCYRYFGSKFCQDILQALKACMPSN